MRNFLSLALIASILLVTSCKKEEGDKKTFGIFSVKNNTTVVMDGEIGSQSLKHFKELHAAWPEINKVEIKECLGSSDDEINLQLCLYVHTSKMGTYILDNGIVASGGTDFFIAGVTREFGNEVAIGVHSWAGEDDNGKLVKATDFQEGHEYHQPYIDYYKAVGFSEQEAKDFYYFTINAAPHDDIHWMTLEELIKYKIITPKE